jgi:hypothetical protein
VSLKEGEKAQSTLNLSRVDLIQQQMPDDHQVVFWVITAQTTTCDRLIHVCVLAPNYSQTPSEVQAGQYNPQNETVASL